MVQPLDFSGASGPYFGLPDRIWVLQFPAARLPSHRTRGVGLTSERWNQARDVARRIRIGPRAREGSTIWPFCVISWVPAVTSLRAADRAGSSSSRQFSGSTDFAASLGQMLLEASLLSRSCLMASSSCWSTGRTFCLRQRSEHHFTPSQFLAHFFRH